MDGEGRGLANGVMEKEIQVPEEATSSDRGLPPADLDLEDTSSLVDCLDEAADGEGGGGDRKHTSIRLSLSDCHSRLRHVAALKRSWFLKEVVHLTKLAVPISLMIFTQQLFFFFSLQMVGHRLGSTALDGLSLGQSFSAVSGRSLIIGLSSAADTLCSQTFGFKNYKKVGIIFQRGVLILSVASFSIIAMWMVSDSIFFLLQQDICVIELSTKFLRLRALALPFFLLQVMLERYLQAQSLVWIFVIIGFAQNLVGILFNFLFLYATNLGVVGLSLSMLVFDCLGPVLLIVYIKWRGLHKKTWGGWSWESLRGWGQFLKYGVAGYLMIAFEWWAFEIATVVTGSISQSQLAANTIIFQVAVIAYMIPLGFGTASAIRVGNELGAGNPSAAKKAAFTGLFIELVIAVIITVFITSTRNVIGRMFTNDEDVLRVLSPALLAALLVFSTDQLQGVVSGVLRGAGKQIVGAVVNFVCYYIIGLPLGISLALLTKLGVTGIWIGVGVADMIQSIVYFICILKFDWNKLSEQAVKNAGGQVEKKREAHDEEANQQLELKIKPEMEEREYGEDTDSLSLTEDSCADETNSEAVESTAPLISEGEADSVEEEKKKEAEYNEEKITRKHKIKLLLTKACVVVVSCCVLVVGVVLAGVLRYDYSLCDEDDSCSLQLSSLLPTATQSSTLYTSSSHSATFLSRTLLLPTPTPAQWTQTL